MNKIDHICIVGGGSAGWLTALMINSYHPQLKVTLIESSEIGILGAGEGTLAGFIRILDIIRIPVSDIILHCKGTIKNGIKFTNWNGGGKEDFYYHAFLASQVVGLFGLNNVQFDRVTLATLASEYKNEKLDEIDFVAKISEKNKVPFSRLANSFEQKSDINPLLDFLQAATYGLHFDANLLAKFLKEVGTSRGIELVDGIVDKINTKQDGYIKSLTLQDGRTIDADFYFDSTGFKRILIQKHFNAPWKSHQDVLPVNTAIPFFIQNDSKVIPPYTEATAMKYGWSWKIPVQGRFGCGYVFDDRFTDIESARQEVIDWYGEVEFPRTFKFDAGYFTEVWVKNCIAVGLAGGFTEPLEATSIFLTTSTIRSAIENFALLEENSEETREEFNATYRRRMEEFVDFLCLHYICPRNDTEFWRTYQQRPFPESLKTILKTIKRRPLTTEDVKRREVYGLESWSSVVHGTNQLDKDLIKRYIEKNRLVEHIEENYDRYKQEINDATFMSWDHYQFLRYLTNRKI